MLPLRSDSDSGAQLSSGDILVDVKTIGLLGGMSWESSIEYYRTINLAVRRRLGTTHSAECVMYSFDFHRIEALQAAGDWDMAAKELVVAAQGLEAAGAELLVICTNTMHILADQIAAATSIPFVHIADSTAAAIANAGVGSPLLLGTRYTMEADFYAGRMRDAGLDVRIPDERDRKLVHRVIYEELVRGRIEDASRTAFLEVIDRSLASGCDSVIAGCTEIELLVTPDDVGVPYFPTAEIHALAAVEAALE